VIRAEIGRRIFGWVRKRNEPKITSSIGGKFLNICIIFSKCEYLEYFKDI